MSKQAMQLVKTWRGLRASESSVARAIAYKSFPFTCEYSISELQADTSLKRNSVARALNAFEAAGWIARKRQQEAGKGNVATMITLKESSQGQTLPKHLREREPPSCKMQLGGQEFVQLASTTRQLALLPGATRLVPPGNKLYKEGKSFRNSFKSSRDTSSSPTPSSDQNSRPDDVISNPKLAPYIESVQQLTKNIPGSRKGFHLGDRKMAFEWFSADIPLAVIEQGLLLGVTRRAYRKEGISEPITPISSLRYFAAVVEEVRHQPLTPHQAQDLRQKVARVYVQKPTVAVSKQAWKMALRTISVRIDPQLSFWGNAKAIGLDSLGVLTVEAPLDYQEGTHGSQELLLDCFHEAGLPASQLVFVKAGRAP